VTCSVMEVQGCVLCMVMFTTWCRLSLMVPLSAWWKPSAVCCIFCTIVNHCSPKNSPFCMGSCAWDAEYVADSCNCLLSNALLSVPLRLSS
jgi:hypothetical protein